MILKISFEGQMLLLTIVSIQWFEMTLQSVAQETGSSDALWEQDETLVCMADS